MDTKPHLIYHLYISNRFDPAVPPLVAVHGIQRRGELQAHRFAPYVEGIGGLLVAPSFDRARFPDYQRLGRHGKGERSDLALRRILEDVGGRTGGSYRKTVLFGYSGGGQFVHRYAMAYPRGVAAMAIAAPGWFTYPDPGIPFPEGIGPTALLPDLRFDPARFLKIPTLVLVGENDTARDASLNRRRRIDRLQGKNRIARARRWTEAMSAAADAYGHSTPYGFRLLHGCGHSFSACMETGRMGGDVIAFLYGQGQYEPSRRTADPQDPSGGHP
jgi:pimeloyl-ACP methyl ester carboxylesterase